MSRFLVRKKRGRRLEERRRVSPSPRTSNRTDIFVLLAAAPLCALYSSSTSLYPPTGARKETEAGLPGRRTAITKDDSHNKKIPLCTRHTSKGPADAIDEDMVCEEDVRFLRSTKKVLRRFCPPTLQVGFANEWHYPALRLLGNRWPTVTCLADSSDSNGGNSKKKHLERKLARTASTSTTSYIFRSAVYIRQKTSTHAPIWASLSVCAGRGGQVQRTVVVLESFQGAIMIHDSSWAATWFAHRRSIDSRQQSPQYHLMLVQEPCKSAFCALPPLVCAPKSAGPRLGLRVFGWSGEHEHPQGTLS